jgi:hypothetical protein
MKDEYDKNYWLLSCDICGVTEAGPFENFDEALQYKRDHPEEWSSLRLKDPADGKVKWFEVCAGCLPKTEIGKWKTFPISKRKPRPELKVDDELTNMANSIAKTINKRKREEV